MPELKGPRHGAPRGKADAWPARAIVVGGGVSGCACAAVLASRGVHVTVIDSVLDTVGMPVYGPVVIPGARGWGEISETMRALPRGLRIAWLNAAMVPENRAPVLIVDRRAVSIETKRMLEKMPGLEFRQGLVATMRSAGENPRPEQSRPEQSRPEQSRPEQSRVVVETFFGEAFEADAVVLAVGLALDGRTRVGAEELPGGRYGEMPARGLLDALADLGASFREIRTVIGANVGSHGCGVPVALTETQSVQHVRLRQALEDLRREWGFGDGAVTGRDDKCCNEESSAVGTTDAVGGVFSPRACEEVDQAGPWGGAQGGTDRQSTGGSAKSPCHYPAEEELAELWPQDYPPAVHWTAGLRSEDALFAETADGLARPLVIPDGAAMAEYCLVEVGPYKLEIGGVAGDAATQDRVSAELTSGSVCSRGVDMEGPASRLSEEVHGLTVTSLDRGGRLTTGLPGKPWIWVTGRAAGTANYLESLRSGARVGEEVADALLSLRHGRLKQGKRAADSANAGPHDDRECPVRSSDAPRQPHYPQGRETT